MKEQGDAIDRYVQEVLERLPPTATGRARIERDLRAHLREATDASGFPREAVREMGPVEETAAGYAESLDLTPVSLADRTGAFLVDVGLGALLSGLVLLIGPGALGNGLGMGLLILLAAVAGAMALLYFPVLEERYGQTLGKRLFGICVARDDGLRPELWRTVVRRLPLFFEFFLLDALFAPFTEKRQRAFDIVAGTIVVPGDEWGGKGAGWLTALLLWAIPASLVLLAS
ncbi:MAG: RDD family protein [Gemmatimonadota bacterium]